MAILAYTISPRSGFTQDQPLAGIYDGDTSSGLRASSAGSELLLNIYFPQPADITTVELWICQFNGYFNGFTGFEIWDSTYTTKLLDQTGLAYGYNSISATAVAPADAYVLKLTSFTDGTNVSLAELRINGETNDTYTLNSVCGIVASGIASTRFNPFRLTSQCGMNVSGHYTANTGILVPATTGALLGGTLVSGFGYSFQSVCGIEAGGASLNGKSICGFVGSGSVTPSFKFSLSALCGTVTVGKNNIALSTQDTRLITQTETYHGFTMQETTTQFVMIEV